MVNLHYDVTSTLELDELVHRYLGNNESIVPEYSREWNAVSDLAARRELDLNGWHMGQTLTMEVTPGCLGRPVCDSITDPSKDCELGDVSEEMLATLACRALLKRFALDDAHEATSLQ